MPKTLNIILADDHQLFMDGLKMVLEIGDQFNVQATATNGAELLELLDGEHPDLIILDINMPGDDGIEVLPKLANLGYEGKVIMLSSSTDTRLVYDAVKKGAKGYLTKKCARTEIVSAIEAVVDGKMYYGQIINQKILEDLVENGGSRKRWEESEPGFLRQLTERELEVLRLIALEFTSKEIGEQLFIASSTVDTHRKNLIEKLKVKNAVGLGKFALRNGLI